jgi:hypothetical protein
MSDEVLTVDKGDKVRCTGSFTDKDGVAVDPTTVNFKFKKPGATPTVYVFGTDSQVVKDSVGNYHVDLNADQSGTWFYRFESTGNEQAAGEAEFIVSRSQF